MHLATTMAAVGVPSVSKQTFTTMERVWSTEMEKQLISSMKVAGAEEKRIAIETGRSHHEVPAITVIVDGGWSKRSHKHSSDANLVWQLSLKGKPRNCSSWVFEINTVQLAALHTIAVKVYLPTSATRTGQNLRVPWNLIFL